MGFDVGKRKPCKYREKFVSFQISCFVTEIFRLENVATCCLRAYDGHNVLMQIAL
jgi:hypothetical protein